MRAQDASDDGGIAGRYILGRGWTSSYPETTGYLVPTLLRVARARADHSLEERASRCIDFLLSVQRPSGAFLGGEVAESGKTPSVFNSAQILHGLTTWYRATGDARTLDAAHRTANWLVAYQDADGAWRRHFYLDTPATYSAHAGCWLAEFGAAVGARAPLEAARRNLEWVLSHQDPSTGWFDRAGFTSREHEDRTALTHTVGYVLRGALLTAEGLAHADGVAAVRRAARGLARSAVSEGTLAGEVDHRWRPRSDYTCLTGNAQLAQVWLHLHGAEPDALFLQAAGLALAEVKRAQLLDDPDEDIRGGIPGSDPIWGRYLRNGYPNWASKFFIDALLDRNRITSASRSTLAGEGAPGSRNYVR